MDVTGKTIAAVGIVVLTIILLSMTGTVVNQVQSQIWQSTQTSTKWNFTGYEGAKSLLGLVPFVWVASILIAAAVGMFAVAKGGGR